MTSSVRDEDGNITVELGDLLSWSSTDGTTYEGVLIELDSNVAIVQLEDGTTKTLEL